MTRLRGDLARRVDRLARRAHRFHRFAHHPLCEAYASEVIRFGRWRFCRGCSLVLGGTLLGLASGLFLSPPSAGALFLLFVFAGVLGTVLLRTHGSGAAKWATRALPGFLAGLLGILSVRRWDLSGAMVGALLLLATAVVVQQYRSRGPWRGRCSGCPERENTPCSGFAIHYRRERAFQALAGRWLQQDRGLPTKPSLSRREAQ